MILKRVRSVAAVVAVCLGLFTGATARAASPEDTFKGKIKIEPDWDSDETNAKIAALMRGEDELER